MTSSAFQRVLQDRIAGPAGHLLLVWHACTQYSPPIPKLLCCPFVHAVYRRLPVAADVAPVHQIRSELHQPAQYPCIRRDFDARTMLQCSFQCSDQSRVPPCVRCSVGPASSHRWSLWHSLASLLTSLCSFLCQRLHHWFTVASECNSSVPRLTNEFCGSLRKTRKLISFSRNQHQHWSQLFFRFLLAKESIVHRHMDHSLQIILSIRSPVRRIHTASRCTELAP